VHVPAVQRPHSGSRRKSLTLDDLTQAGEAIVRAAVLAAR
jgi:hypothetical protein